MKIYQNELKNIQPKKLKDLNGYLEHIQIFILIKKVISKLIIF